MLKPSKNPIVNFFRGLNYIAGGFRLLNQPGIRQFVIIPLIINVLLFAIMFGVGAHYYAELTAYITASIPSWLQWLSWLLWAIFFLSFFMITVYLFTFLANIIAAPFNNLLAQKVEEKLTGVKVPEQSWRQMIATFPKEMWREVLKLMYYLPCLIIFSILFLIPAINAIAGILWFLFNAWMMTQQYVDYPFDNHLLPFQQTRKFMANHKFISLGFGMPILLLSMIPIVNFFIMPTAVIAAAKFYVDMQDTAVPAQLDKNE